MATVSTYNYQSMGRQYWTEPCKYLVIGGDIASRGNSKKKRISGLKLAHLYGLNPDHCRVYNRPNWLIRGVRDISGLMLKIAEEDPPIFQWEEWTVFRPRSDGHYEMFRWFGDEMK